MKIAIFSDLHDNLKNLEKFLGWCKNNEVAELICAGDLTNSETLENLAAGFPGQIQLARGNMDIYGDQEPENFSNINYLGRAGRIAIEKKNVGICHEPDFIPRVTGLGECEIIFYGHTHKPWIKEKNGTTIANPGTLGAVFQKSTFAVWEPEAGKLELKMLENLD